MIDRADKGKGEGGSVWGMHVSCKRTTMELVYKEDTHEKVERSNYKGKNIPK